MQESRADKRAVAGRAVAGRSVVAIGRRGEGGFTLIELMVAVTIIAIFAALAIPAMLRSNDDRKAFEMAHRTAQLFQSARGRALSTGSAHLVLLSTSGLGGTADRGTFTVYQGYYNTVIGPGVASGSCILAGQWGSLQAVAPSPFPVGPTGVLVDGLNYIYATSSTLRSEFVLNGVGGGTAAVLCFTPGGRVYYSPTIGGLATAAPLAQTFEVRMQRYPTGAPEGLNRAIMINGSDMARVRSF